MLIDKKRAFVRCILFSATHNVLVSQAWHCRAERSRMCCLHYAEMCRAARAVCRTRTNKVPWPFVQYPRVTMGLALSIVTWVNQRFRGGYRRCLASSCTPTATVFYSVPHVPRPNCNCSALDTHFYMINSRRHSRTATRYNRLAFGFCVFGQTKV